MLDPTDHRSLDALGRRFARRVARRLTSTSNELAAVREVASKSGVGVAEVRTAYLFAKALDAIETVVPGARQTILSSHNLHLTPSVVTDVSRRPADRVR